VRGDSIRDLYAKTLALLVLGALAGTGVLVDYWPVGLSTPAVPGALSVGPAIGPLALDAVSTAVPAAVPAEKTMAAPPRQVARHLDAATAPAALATRNETGISRMLPVAVPDVVGLGPAVWLPDPEQPAEELVLVAAMAVENPVLTLEPSAEEPESVATAHGARLVPAASAAGVDEGDGLITGAMKKTGSSILKTGARTGASIFDMVRVVGGMVRRALPAD
jgi:hypothetical protein